MSKKDRDIKFWIDQYTRSRRQIKKVNHELDEVCELAMNYATQNKALRKEFTFMVKALRAIATPLEYKAVMLEIESLSQTKEG
jgi:hypothetical protein